MNAPADVLEQRLLDAFGPEAAEIDLRAREASRLDPVSAILSTDRDEQA
jgi:hypothetical protein